MDHDRNLEHLEQGDLLIVVDKVMLHTEKVALVPPPLKLVFHRYQIVGRCVVGMWVWCPCVLSGAWLLPKHAWGDVVASARYATIRPAKNPELERK